MCFMTALVVASHTARRLRMPKPDPGAFLGCGKISASTPSGAGTIREHRRLVTPFPTMTCADSEALSRVGKQPRKGWRRRFDSVPGHHVFKYLQTFETGFRFKFQPGRYCFLGLRQTLYR